MAASSTLTFLNPFEGPPVSIKLAGVLTFDPEVHLKLSGTPLSALFAAEGLQPWYRKAIRLQKSAAPNRERRAHKLMSEFAALRPQVFDSLPDLQLALAGDGAAQARLDQMSSFEALNRGRGRQRADLTRHQAYLMEVGAADLDLTRHVHRGDMAGAVAHMAAHPILRHLLWPRAEAVMRKASHVNELMPLFGAMALDVHLGWIAAWETHERELGRQSSCFSCLLPSARRPGRNPTSLFFDELKRRLGARTAAEILKRAPARSGFDQSTVERWRAGTHMPDEMMLRLVLRAHGLDQPDELLYAQLACSRHIHLLGHLGQRLQAMARAAEQPHRFWPWPAYPFELSDFEFWADYRYPFWLEFHRNRNAGGDADRSIPRGHEG